MSQNNGYLNQYPQAPVKKKGHGWIIALIVGGAVILLAFFALILFAFLFLFSNAGSSGPRYSGSEGYIAVLHIEGTITSTTSSSFLSSGSPYNQEYLMSTVDTLMDDSANKGIMLYIDTPGGEVYATDELYLKLE